MLSPQFESNIQMPPTHTMRAEHGIGEIVFAGVNPAIEDELRRSIYVMNMEAVSQPEKPHILDSVVTVEPVPEELGQAA